MNKLPVCKVLESSDYFHARGSTLTCQIVHNNISRRCLSVHYTVLSDAACARLSGKNCAQLSRMDDTIQHLLDIERASG